MQNYTNIKYHYWLVTVITTQESDGIRRSSELVYTKVKFDDLCLNSGCNRTLILEPVSSEKILTRFCLVFDEDIIFDNCTFAEINKFTFEHLKNTFPKFYKKFYIKFATIKEGEIIHLV